jgi:hypothetical protein
MKALITLAGAGTAIVLGLAGLSVWYESFLNFLAVLVPFMLLVVSGLAITIGLAEIKDTAKDESSS